MRWPPQGCSGHVPCCCSLGMQGRNGKHFLPRLLRPIHFLSHTQPIRCSSPISPRWPAWESPWRGAQGRLGVQGAGSSHLHAWGHLAARTNDRRCPFLSVPSAGSVLYTSPCSGRLRQCYWKGQEGGPGCGGAHQVILLGVCSHAPHPVAVGVLGQAVGKLLRCPRLGTVEHDDVPALEKARHTRSGRDREPQAS